MIQVLSVFKRGAGAVIKAPFALFQEQVNPSTFMTSSGTAHSPIRKGFLGLIRISQISGAALTSHQGAFQLAFRRDDVEAAAHLITARIALLAQRVGARAARNAHDKHAHIPVRPLPLRKSGSGLCLGTCLRLL